MTAPNIEELLPAAQKLADALGRTPGLAVLKKELKIGEPRAKALRDLLNGGEGGSPKTSLPQAPVSPGMGPVRDLPETALPSLPETEEGPDGDGGEPPWEAAFQGPPPWEGAFTEDIPGTAVEEVPAVVVGTIPSPAPVVPPVTAPATPVVASPKVPKAKKDIALWPLLIIVLPAFVAIWGGWVDLGQMSGFGNVNLLPGLTDKAVINLSITLPVGLEAYASYAIYVWLSLDKGQDETLRKFAKWSAVSALVVGGLGQGIYHLLKAFDQVKAPWPVVIFVALIPVVVSGLGAYLAHGVRHGRAS